MIITDFISVFTLQNKKKIFEKQKQINYTLGNLKRFKSL